MKKVTPRRSRKLRPSPSEADSMKLVAVPDLDPAGAFPLTLALRSVSVPRGDLLLFIDRRYSNNVDTT
ncbi:uncharacterized protein ARMOST_17562 [Armillaria ostoyae]|uniref:Uncharacterized protein n=1 Tax=Armillaria ostoyae TaxID=47428 RepID=A0A284RZD9_ARMOS|nr:uncharacterized protein ARMOST_17562 [Armillaria ostoyae]